MSFAVHVAAAELAPDDLDPSSVVSGDPRTSSAVLHEGGRATIEIKGGPALEVGHPAG